MTEFQQEVVLALVEWLGRNVHSLEGALLSYQLGALYGACRMTLVLKLSMTETAAWKGIWDCVSLIERDVGSEEAGRALRYARACAYVSVRGGEGGAYDPSANLTERLVQVFQGNKNI